ncbi:TonB-dependent receptor plug domain-containing protein, partial [Salmonella enterica subsp. enterica serovar Typhimurium]|nr:TonB-dependent receptor plug domain-containing protein [Salmonella enterica subsp. enterica serovar Typhimurium]
KILFSHTEYEISEKEILIENPIHITDDILNHKVQEVKEVIINSEVSVNKIKNQPLTVSVLETKNLLTKAGSNADILRKISGVNIRQNGGLGSDANFSVNGMSGKQIRFFLDGIPLEYYNSEMNIGSVPAIFFSRFEIYKGAVPITLASDALGGAVNFISRDESKNQMDISYGMGSFNTHKFVLNAKYYGKQSTYWKLNAFVNHSDNDYKMQAEV